MHTLTVSKKYECHYVNIGRKHQEQRTGGSNRCA